MQPLRKAHRFAIAVVGAEVVPFGILELLPNERLGQRPLSDELLESRRWTICQGLAKTAFVVSSVSEDDGTLLPALRKGRWGKDIQRSRAAKYGKSPTQLERKQHCPRRMCFFAWPYAVLGALFATGLGR